MQVMLANLGWTEVYAAEVYGLGSQFSFGRGLTGSWTEWALDLATTTLSLVHLKYIFFRVGHLVLLIRLSSIACGCASYLKLYCLQFIKLYLVSL